MDAMADDLLASLIELDTLLREIRAENLDGSEPAIAEALEASYAVIRRAGGAA